MAEEKNTTENGTNKKAIYTQITGGAVGIIIGSVILIWLLRKIANKK